MKLKLYEVNHYFGGPYERGTCCVNSVFLGYLLAKNKKDAFEKAIHAYDIPSGFVFDICLIRRDNVEILAKILTMKIQLKVLEEWLDLTD